MLITKKSICILIAIVGIIVICGLSVSGVAAVWQRNSLGVIVLDAGHGGIDGGVADGDIKESNVNLEICNLLKAELEKCNFIVVMTRSGDDALGGTKRADMEKRKEIILKAKPIMAISIHVNKWRTANRRGAQVFYDDSGKNKDFAEYTQSVLNAHVNSKYSKRTDLKALGGDYFIAKCTQYPTVIVETGFISNSEDRRLLMDKQYRADIVAAIANVAVAVALEHLQ